MLTGFASMRLPPVEDIVLGPPGDGAPRRCSGTACAQSIVIVSWGFIHRLRLAGDASGAVHGAPAALSACTCSSRTWPIFPDGVVHRWAHNLRATPPLMARCDIMGYQQSHPTSLSTRSLQHHCPTTCGDVSPASV